MYAKSVPAAPKLEYPYQEQQRYSGSFVVSEGKPSSERLPQETIREIVETAKKLAPAGY